MWRFPIYILFILFLALGACSPDRETKFTLLSPQETGIHFDNRLEDSPDFNILNYLYFYDGGGVAAGDITNNGLPDLFFVGNSVPNRLYLNLGDFQFEDITEQAGITDSPDAWSTGVTMADVNGNGYLDIYVSRANYLSKSGPNQLFINNGDGTFTERAAEFGLDFEGYSTQAVFFDFNKSGRLDLFLLNHSFHSELTYGQAEVLRQIPDPRAGDRLFRNDGDTFTDVTEEAGIYSSALGYGLGVAVSDLNHNGWPDIYVGNDFHEDDYLYINNGDGTFTEALYESVGHTSGSSMGNDIADITNNGYPDIISLDMMPEDRELFMRSGGPDLVVVSETKQEFGFGQKNARNTLQWHRGLDPDGVPIFSEIAFMSGVARTDWSWASLFLDMDNSGYNDLYVTNGMVRRPNDLDFVRARNVSRERSGTEEGGLQGEQLSEAEMEMLRYMPELKIPNYAFRNRGDLTFDDSTLEWGFDQPSFSSGAAYADLNNNGRLDLVVNNINMPAFIYRNNTPESDTTRFLKIELKGEGMNSTGIGAKIMLYVGDRIYYREQMPTRGFQSSVDHTLHFGLGSVTLLDSLLVVWPDGRFQTLTGVESNRTLQLAQAEASGTFTYERLHRAWESNQNRDISEEIGLSFRHNENPFNDYSREPLMPYKLSTQGPALAVGDVNGNGLDDIYIGGARWQAGALYLQNSDGSFFRSQEELFFTDRESEDVDAVFFDATGNGYPDLYVVSGGGELTGIDDALKDRLYVNDGEGGFKKSEERLPPVFMNGSVVRPADINGNGHLDLFVGSRAVPFRYGVSPRSFLLINDGTGHFRDLTVEIAPELSEIGLVTDALWLHQEQRTHPDLVVAGEWMPVRFFRNDGSSLVMTSGENGIPAEGGLWQSLYSEDLNGNGYPDIIAGNFGVNSRLQASSDSPLRLYINDFDDNGQTAPLIASLHNGEYYPFEQLDELLLHFPFLTQRIRSYSDFAGRTVRDLFGREKIESAEMKEVSRLESVIYWNNGNGSFRSETLPNEAQLSPVLAAVTLNTERNGLKDLFLGGNLHEVKPSMGGRQDASFGVYLQSGPEGVYRAETLHSSGLILTGEVRNLRIVHREQDKLLIAARNDESMLTFILQQSP